MLNASAGNKGIDTVVSPHCYLPIAIHQIVCAAWLEALNEIKEFAFIANLAEEPLLEPITEGNISA